MKFPSAVLVVTVLCCSQTQIVLGLSLNAPSGMGLKQLSPAENSKTTLPSPSASSTSPTTQSSKVQQQSIIVDEQVAGVGFGDGTDQVHSSRTNELPQVQPILYSTEDNSYNNNNNNKDNPQLRPQVLPAIRVAADEPSSDLLPPEEEGMSIDDNDEIVGSKSKRQSTNSNQARFFIPGPGTSWGWSGSEGSNGNNGQKPGSCYRPNGNNYGNTNYAGNGFYYSSRSKRQVVYSSGSQPYYTNGYTSGFGSSGSGGNYYPGSGNNGNGYYPPGSGGQHGGNGWVGGSGGGSGGSNYCYRDSSCPGNKKCCYGECRTPAFFG